MQIEIKNKLSDNELFRIKRMKEVIKTTHPHGHKEYLEIIYLTQGEGLHQIDHHRFPVSGNSIYLVMPGQIHNWELTAIPKGYVIMVQKDFLLGHPLYDALFQTFPLTFSSGYILETTAAIVQGIFESIENEFASRKPNYQAVIQTYLLLLFNLLKREAHSGISQPEPPLLKSFFELVALHYKTMHEVAWYAAELNVTAKTLNANCRRFLDKTAGAVINEKLTTESKRMLLYSQANMGEIAYELAFTDPSHFNKFFKRQTGVLPSVYRKGIS
ncbi:MAG: AraC family transcriptional regulator [Dyadobacter sp. 50-39]|uniref:AraC family transcriptional regulator n=1 Tax=Dyadobacter sp. 50-39 TaxID=1895756 RepID=UPI0009651F71|nr:helix-turn-helix transcriptional regulator [Dyadobacter sp. 50-39]OJV14770.1 MAG: AraC family transcriptional regulator [Dyadobacter sp. 50-39]